MDHEDIEHWVDAFKNILFDQPVSVSHRNIHWRFEVVVELNLNAAIVNLRFGMHFKLAIE
jgi:hypothetical protein